jgi:uncharacterized protein involved in outer membrane biogenesis
MRLTPVRILLILGSTVVGLILATALVVWWFVTPNRIRTALEAQASTALGEPVSIRALSVRIVPRVSLRLQDVRVGSPARLDAALVDVSTDLRGLLRREINDAELTIRSSRVDLPALLGIVERLAASPQPAGSTGGSKPAVTVVSVRTIALEDVQLVSGTHAVVASATGTLAANRLTLTRLHAAAPGTELTASGTVSFAPASAALRIDAEHVNVEELAGFIGSIAVSQPGGSRSRTSTAGSGNPIRVTAELGAKNGSLAGVAFTGLTGRVDLQEGTVSLDPLRATVFGGRLTAHVRQTPGGSTDTVRLTGALEGADTSSILAWLGQAPDTVSGRLSGTLDVSAKSAMQSAGAWAGTASLTLRDGSIKGLSVVRRTVVTFAGRSGQQASAAGSDRFDRLSGLFALSGGQINCRDLAMTSPDLDLRGAGTIALPSGALNLRAQGILSPELSAQAGRDLYRYAHEGNRIVLPITISGRLGAPSPSIDTSNVLQRAIRNKVEEEAGSLLRKLLKKKP